jgi:hypothetical protein
MQKKIFCVLFLFTIALQNLFAQQIDKVIISGYGDQHDLDVKNAFLIGYASYNNTPFTGQVILYSYPYTLQNSFDYAVTNDYDLIIRSTTGLSTGLRLAPSYPTVELVMPAGTNIYTQVFFGDVLTSPVVITGAGEDSNQTGYKLEFYSEDPITGTSLSSYSNGYVAGQLAFIANTLNCSFDSARVLAREKGTEGGMCDFYNGFGKVQPQYIVTNTLPVELTTFGAKLIGKNVKLIWQTSNEVNNYGFEIERSEKLDARGENWEKIGFVHGNGNSDSPKEYSFIDDQTNSSGIIKYRLKQIDNDGQFDYSDVISITTSPNEFELFQNYPNPFNPSTKISWQTSLSGWQTLIIYDILGNKIATLVDEFREAGNYTEIFDATIINRIASGIYINKIEIKSDEILYTMTKKMTMMK